MAPRRRGLVSMLRDLGGAVTPLAIRDLAAEIDEKLSKVPTRVNEFGFDRYGMEIASVRRSVLPAAVLYRYYFRAQTFGIERMPAGRVLLISNHAGQLPFDATMLGVATLLEASPPRIARGMGEYWIPQLPFVNWLATRAGQLVGTPENCAQLLEGGECVMVFPEGVRGMNKTWDQRYRLQRFGTGFMRLALETQTPIVPVGIVGSEEQQPGLLNLRGLGRALGMPAFPITPTFPWLGPLGLLPLPVRYRIHFGEPLHFTGDSNDEDAAIEARVEEVRIAIASLLEHGVAEREGVFT
ncbi:MAG TPA: lysophospholipid acyltransferase family protein [Myxococcota bacterium]|nr:lysophospholipid acyltransferase family protein [Myxococcota bacterium]